MMQSLPSNLSNPLNDVGLHESHVTYQVEVFVTSQREQRARRVVELHAVIFTIRKPGFKMNFEVTEP